MSDPNFDERYVDALAALGTVRSFPRNTILIHEGDKSDQLYVVLSGRLKLGVRMTHQEIANGSAPYRASVAHPGRSARASTPRSRAAA